MPEIQKKALYNLLRLNSIEDPSIQTQPWQIEDYRQLSNENLFERLGHHSIYLDRVSFIAYADACESPEEMTEVLIGDSTFSAQEEDQVYLLVFELWRRLMTAKPSLSILCDELDHQIFLYDQKKLESLERLQEVLDGFFIVLGQNVDEGLKPQEALKRISSYCAQDIQSFLYDFISDQMDAEHESYARDLLEDAEPYLEGNKRFSLLRARLLTQWPLDAVHSHLEKIINDNINDKDLEFNFDLLDFIVTVGPHALFCKVVEQTIPLLTTEQDFQDLLTGCLDYYQRIDQEQHEQHIKEILQRREEISRDQIFDKQDKELENLRSIIRK